jgi:hypothetical protein
MHDGVPLPSSSFRVVTRATDEPACQKSATFVIMHVINSDEQHETPQAACRRNILPRRRAKRFWRPLVSVLSFRTRDYASERSTIAQTEQQRRTKALLRGLRHLRPVATVVPAGAYAPAL